MSILRLFPIQMNKGLPLTGLSSLKILSAVLLATCVLVESCGPARTKVVDNSPTPADLSDLALVIHYPTPAFIGLKREYISLPDVSGLHPSALPLLLAYEFVVFLPYALIEGFRDLSPPEQVLNEEIRKGSLDNPARLTQERLVAILGDEKDLSQVRLPKEAQEPFGDDELVSALKEKYGDLTLLDFDPTSWGLVKVGDKYKFHYEIRSRLMNLKTPKISWQRTCVFIDKEPSSLEELAKDSAARLKEKIVNAANECAQEFYCHLSGKQCL